jgi:ADP-ribose pyrophosphatase
MRRIEDKVIYKGKWLKFKEAKFVNDEDKEVVFEYVQGANGSRNVVMIIAKLKPSNRYILIKQFRPAINDYVLAFPAGICDSDDYEKDALRELKEETGYVGEKVKCSMKLAIFPGLIDTMVRVCEVEVNENLPSNKNPIQDLEDAEEIEVILKTKDEIKDLINNCKVKISAYLWLTFNNF